MRCVRLPSRQSARRSNSVGRVRPSTSIGTSRLTVGEVVQEVERAVVGPVQVFELQHDRALPFAASPQTRRNICAAAWKARLRICLGVVLDAADVAAVAEVEADQVAQQVGVGLGHVRAVVGRTAARCPASIFRLGGLDAVAVGDLQPPGEDVAQQAVGLALGLRGGAAAGRGRSASGRASLQASNS